jgi:hypothetical protein
MRRVSGILTRVFLLVVFFIVLVTTIALARGYRFNFDERTVISTGILSVNSAPNAAKIFVNDELKGVTNTNVSLPPGNYSVRISKEGFTEWKKDVKLLGEIVLSFDAVLFPKNPSLSPLTNLGIVKAVPVGQSANILLFSKTGNVEKDGIYVLDGNSRRISITSPLRRIILATNLPKELDFSTAQVIFSPDYREAIFTFNYITPDLPSVSYLFSLESENTDPFDVTASKNSILVAWDRERQRQLGKILEAFPEKIEQIATNSFRIIAFSPDETKILYQASAEVTIPQIITPALIGANQTKEKRTLVKNKLYVYDLKEDKNFEIEADLSKLEPAQSSDAAVLDQTAVEKVALQSESVNTETAEEATTTPNILVDRYNSLEVFDYIQWYPSSRHLVFNEGNTISILDYDGSNKQAVYSGPYEKTFFALNSDWKLLVLANLNPQNNTFGDIYEIGIR